jgi:hypothetical protein
MTQAAAVAATNGRPKWRTLGFLFIVFLVLESTAALLQLRRRR